MMRLVVAAKWLVEEEHSAAAKRLLRGPYELHAPRLEPARTSNVWVPMFPDQSVILSMYVGSKTSEVFLRGPRASDGKKLAEFMTLHSGKLDEAFGPSRSKTEGYYYSTKTDIPLAEEQRWDELIDWMDSQRRRYVEVFQAIDEAERSK